MRECTKCLFLMQPSTQRSRKSGRRNPRRSGGRIRRSSPRGTACGFEGPSGGTPLALEGFTSMCLGVPLEGLVSELRRLLDEGEVELLYIRCVAELDLVVYCASHEDSAHGPQANGV